MHPMPIRLTAFAVLAAALPARAADPTTLRYGQTAPAERPAAAYLPAPGSEEPAAAGLRNLVEHYVQDRDALARYHGTPASELTLRRMREFNDAWLGLLDGLAYDALGTAGRIDWHLLRLHLRHERVLGERTAARQAETPQLVPFAGTIARLHESRRAFEPVDHARVAGELAGITARLKDLRRKLETADAPRPTPGTALRAAQRTSELAITLRGWFDHYNGYDPRFSWWMKEPQKAAVAALEGHAKFLRENLVGQKEGEDEPIVGDPIGAEGLRADLDHEMIPYTPEELIAAAGKSSPGASRSGARSPATWDWVTTGRRPSSESSATMWSRESSRR